MAQSIGAQGVVRNALRAWDISHPRLWGTAINEGRVPWGGSEEIAPRENLEELIMLGLRIREGLDLNRLNRAIASSSDTDADGSSRLKPIDPTQLKPMVDEGLITLARGSGGTGTDGVHAIPTRKGRLLNDAVIERLFDLIGV